MAIVFFSPGVSVSQFSRTNLSSVLNVNTFFFLRELNFSKVKKKTIENWSIDFYVKYGASLFNMGISLLYLVDSN